MTSKGQDIRTFFQPKPPPARPGVSAGSDALPPSSPQASPAIAASSPVTPLAPRPARGRNDVILDSDDEGDEDDEDSDDSLPDLNELVQRARPEPKDPCVTPKSKRVAGPHQTPLSIRSKKTQESHKYDLQALSRLDKEDVAADAHGEAVDALLSSTNGLASSAGLNDAALERNLDEFVGDDSDDGGATEKLRRAIKGTDGSAVRQSWYFFEQQFDPGTGPRQPFPNAEAEGCWAHLAKPHVRRQHLLSGFPRQMIRRGYAMSDELFLWIMHQIPLEEDRCLREQYIATVRECLPGSQHAVDAECIRKLFRSLGALQESVSCDSTRLRLVPEVATPYPERRWDYLISVLKVLAELFTRNGDDDPHFHATEVSSCAMKLLLRLGIDSLLVKNSAVLEGYQNAVEALSKSVPDSKWDKFCFDTITSIHASVDAASTRWQVVSCLIPSTGRLHDFRRRLAAVSLFDDLDLANRVVSDSISMRELIDRARSDAFVVNHYTDHQKLAAMACLLDVVVDDGLGRDGPRFNQDVDDLSRLIENLARGTTGGDGSRLDSKTLSQWIPGRLKYTVRTRRPPKTDRYGDMTNDDEEDRPPKPKQQTLARYATERVLFRAK